LDGQFRRDVGGVPRIVELEAARPDGALRASAGRLHGRAGEEVRSHRQAEVEIDDAKGEIKITVLKTVVETVEDPAREIALEEAKLFDEGFEPGDVMEEPLDFTVFGRAAIQAPSSASSSASAKASAPRFATSSPPASATSCPARSSRSSAASWSSCSTSSAKRKPSFPYREQNHREHFHQGEPIRAVLKRVEETPRVRASSEPR
jgi:N utilization substance protein A